MEEWTKTNITPSQIEDIGFVDLTAPYGTSLAIYVYSRALPTNVAYIFMNFLASHWELSFESESNGEEYHNVRTAEEFNHWMKYLGVDIEITE